MKTRIFTMTGMILLSVATIAGAADNRVMNSSAASGHESTTIQINHETMADQPAEMTSALEEWVESRNNWEREGVEMNLTAGVESSSVLNEWIAARDNWEQEGKEVLSATIAPKGISLQEWVASRESWEQEGMETATDFASRGDKEMEEWIAAIAEWEQK